MQRYDLADEKRRQFLLAGSHKTALSFNALAVIVLATKDEGTTLPEAPFTRDEAYGVLISDEAAQAAAHLAQLDERDQEDQGVALM